MKEEFIAKLTGILTHEPEMKISQAGRPFCKLSVVVNLYFRETKEKKPMYYTVFVNDEWMLQRVKQAGVGWRVCAHGSPNVNAWVDKKTGEVKSQVVMWSDDVYFIQKEVNANDGLPNL